MKKLVLSKTTDFTIHNLPYGVFRTRSGGNGTGRIGCAIGDKILDLNFLARKNILHASLAEATLNRFMASDKSVWTSTRHTIQNLLSDFLSSHVPEHLEESLINQADAEMLLPASIGDYTDFYASEVHASNVGKMFRPSQEPLLPNWKHLPVGYHGRASSIVVSGTPIVRPSGQIKRQETQKIDFGESEKLDFEVEIAMFFGGEANALGKPIPIDKAKDHIFGVVLLNDWSARDIQFWEYVPLGPFLSKNFATTISPWVVPWEALEPFLVPLAPQTNPAPLPYLKASSDHLIDMNIVTTMNNTEISRTNSKHLYWSFPQMIAHHTASGCNMRAGDLLGSGTISSPEPSGFGSLLELTWNGQKTINTLEGDRRFIQNGDTVVMSAFCEREGKKVGFGSCSGVVVKS
jgi:fumarylacetoacetase